MLPGIHEHTRLISFVRLCSKIGIRVPWQIKFLKTKRSILMTKVNENIDKGMNFFWRPVLIIGLVFVFHTCMINSQEKVVDQIVAVVGNNIIMLSEIENQYLQLISQGVTSNRDLKCDILEEFLSQKLLINQAKIDSIEVSEAQVELQLEQRLQFFVNQIGSEEKLEEYFNKSVLEIKEDLRDVIRDQLITQQMQAEIAGDIQITPSEVKSFYNNMHEDSIPLVNAQIELYQILKYPPYNEEAIFEVKERLLKLRERILNGERFSKLAVLYSEGPSATRGGDIGFSTRAELDPAYAKAAFSLPEGGVSKIVESAFGYHIIQVVERREDRVKTRHILMKPKVPLDEGLKAKKFLDSISVLIRTDSMNFESAARRFSEDESTSMNGGQVVNPETGNPRFEIDQLDPKEYYIIKDLKVGEISEPFETTDKNGKTVYKILKVKSRIEPHQANLKQDFNLLKNMAIVRKQDEVIQEWIAEKQKSTYIHIDESFVNCDFISDGWVK